MRMLSTDEYQQYRVPRQDRSTLVSPSPEDLLSGLARSTLSSASLTDGESSGVEFCGKSLALARQQARAEVVQKALDFTHVYSDSNVQELDFDNLPAVILSGHQPELFHAGVWFKNFLLSGLSAQAGAIGINFLVDNDLCRSTAIRVPGHAGLGHAGLGHAGLGHAGLGHAGLGHARLGHAEATDFSVQSVPFDATRDAIPWELRRLESRDCWMNFPKSVQQTLLSSVKHPLLHALWPDAIEAVKRTDRVGLAIAEARHKLERRIGLQTLEVPLSHLVSTRAFARFSIQLLSELPRFQDIYNSQLMHYRVAHRIRSHAHPVPALAQHHDWLEAPWWVYRSEAPQRQPLWVRFSDDQLILSDRAGWQATVEGRLDCDNASSQWLDLLADGVCLRPRALLTTMYLRIMVSDLFLHGIGGGKYDQLTDGIIRSFFGMEPSPMAVATATLHLPHGLRVQSDEDPSSALDAGSGPPQPDRLWQLKYHADQFLEAPNAEAQELIQKKRQLLANVPARGNKWLWHREMTTLNKRLSQLAAAETQAAIAARERQSVAEKNQRLLDSREYSFCLFPQQFVTDQLRSMAGG